jgi:hypothetical protein
VALDWTIDLLFAKDTVQLGLTGRAGRAGALELGESRRAA